MFSVPNFICSALILSLPAFLLFCSYLIAACTSPLVNTVFIGAADISGNGGRSLLNESRNIFGNVLQLV